MAHDGILEHAQRPRNLREMDQPDGRAHLRSDCGHDQVEFFVRLQAGAIAEVSFLFQGCAYTVACGSVATELAAGLPVAEARRAISPDAISEALGGLPEGNYHCAELAAAAFRATVDDAVHSAREPWRKLYRR